MTAAEPATNDNSNPQQGAPFRGASNRRVFRVPPSKKDDRKLFVGGLPGNITEAEFKEFFEQFGVLIDSVVMFDRETRRSRGFGFVTFEDPMVCRNLLMMGNEGADPENAMNLVGRLEMQGKVCEVKAATPKAGARNRHVASSNSDSLNGHSGHFHGSPQVAAGGPPGMHYHAYHHHPGMLPPAAVYYPPPPYVPHVPHPVAYTLHHPFMEYPHLPMAPVPPSVEPYHAGNPQQHGGVNPYPPVIGIPAMPFEGPPEQQLYGFKNENNNSVV